jgi:hypothetical protein
LAAVTAELENATPETASAVIGRVLSNATTKSLDAVAFGTADSTAWTADTHCVTADGRIICIEAELVEAAVALDAIDAALGANVVSADVLEGADALDQLDAVVVTEIVSVPGGAYYPPPRLLPVYGVGYGVLPQLEGEAHGEVGVAGDGEGDNWPDDVELMLMMLAA